MREVMLDNEYTYSAERLLESLSEPYAKYIDLKAKTLAR